MSSLMPDCTLKCRSQQHALDVVSVVTQGSEGQIKAFLTSHCYNAATNKDVFGRNALHIASSCGKKGVLDWLVETNGVDLLAKDKESGWTALHRAIFYGHIDCAWSLLKHGVSLYIQDKEGLSPLDLVMKDRPAHVTFKNTDPTEVYTWGNNINFTLGHGSQQSKHHPELVDLFPRSGIYIKQVILCKFHSVFLSQKGQIYTCGHGQGGRLGHGDEQTCLIPRLVESLLGHQCTQVAAAKDHTLVLTEEGCVYTFGLNNFHQLGVLPPPPSCNLPRQVQAKNLKGRSVIGVAAGRFHTVLWTKEAVYTIGLNGGQLGYLLDPNGEKCVTSPRQVSALHHKDITLSFVTASDGATVCVTEKGDIYLLTDYQCKKIASKQLNLKKVLVTGGNLEYRVAPQHLKENGGQRISVLALDKAGRVFSWKSANSPMKQCRWLYGRQVYVSDISLNRDEMMFVTQDGEAFRGKWINGNKNPEKAEIVSNLHNSSNDVSSGETNNIYERIRLEKLAFVHRAVSITTDPNGCNFAVLQSDPKTSLYEIPSVSTSSFSKDFDRLLAEAEVMDTIHDVTFQIGSRMFPVHKYVLSMRSDFFRKLFASDHTWPDSADVYRKDEDDIGCDLFVIEKLQPDLFMYLLQYIYTDSCDLLIHGHKPKTVYKEKMEENEDTLISNLNKITVCGDVNKSAFEVYRSNQMQVGNDKQNKPKSTSKKCKGVREEVSLIKMLQVAAKKFGLGNLSSRLDGVRIENGKINIVNRKSGNKPKLNQKKCSYLCDVTMKSIDGKEFPCHKCVLCARLEYFHSMLCSSWIEASRCAALEMPFPSDILQIILDYIYTDEAVSVKESQNVEFICNVLVVADQLLMLRLKEICEVAIAEKLTLKNAAELLEFASMYNADQLKQSCLQFIVLNMAAILETRALDVLSEDVLKELAASYRKRVPAMSRRVITPYQDGPDISSLEPEEGETFVFLKEELSSEQATQEALLKKAKAKAKKKPRRRSDSSGGYNLSDIIQSPPSTGILKLDKTNSVESLPEMLTSDSEGSCVGVSSPRDLQSPDFTAGFHADKSEVKEKVCVPTAVIPQVKKEMKASGRTSLQKISHPQYIPNSNTSASSTNWVVGSSSPASPPAMDLRTIMEIEENLQKCGSTPKTNSGKPISHGSKLSQKQRKMIALAAKDNNPEIVLDATVPLTPPKTAKPGNVWASSLPSALPKSFRDLLVEKEKVVGASSGKVCIKAMEDRQIQQPVSPWLAASLLGPPVPITFAEIVEEEIQQEAALIRSREKPLALIQIEERAIQDLLIHYQAVGNPDEFIVIERSPQGPIAAPMWNKH